MAKLSKRMKAIREKVEPGKAYPIDEALQLLKEIPHARFTEAVDVAVNLGVDPRKSDQVVRGSTVLPHGTGKSVRVAVFAQGENAEKAKAAGADVVGFEDLAEEIKKGNLDFDVVIANVEFDPQDLKENLEALLADLKKAKPAAAKGQYMKKISLSTTMGPGIPVDQASLGV